MKKNVMMRVASIMLVLVLMSSSVISGTFAKYVTSGESTDTARVAKFGVKVTANGDTFAKGYVLDGTVATEVEGSASVWSINGEDLVAPGTYGELAEMTLSGQPEVDVKVTYDAVVTINDKWVADGDNYFPLLINVNGTPVAYDVDADPAVIAAAIEGAIEAYSRTYDANTDLATVAADSLAIAWSWPFESGADQAEKDANNKKDTALGDAAAWNLANAGKITIKITTYVTQVD